MAGLLLAVALGGLASALLARHRCGSTHPLGVDDLVLVGAGWLAIVGIAATVLALASAFSAPGLTIVTAAIAIAAWPWRDRTRARAGFDRKGLVAGAIVLVAGFALRLPLNEYALAGRDQGTYTLRAQHAIRTGGVTLHDPVLAAASRDAATRSGPADLLGLYPIRDDAWARDRYEGAYRPGLYLADRERGAIVPQFFHLHPMLMATAGLVLGPSHVTWGIALPIALALLAGWAVARRIWPHGPWAWIATGLIVVSPLAIWVHRTALTETPAAALSWAAVLAVLRTRDGARELPTAAFLLGATAWLRGHAWIVAPVFAAIVWCVPRSDRAARSAALLWVLVVVAGVLAHAGSIYPYLHDELTRQLLPTLHPRPAEIVGAAIAGAIAWWAIDELSGAGRTRERIAIAMQRAPAILAIAALVVLVVWAVRHGMTTGAPFSRLDPTWAGLGIAWIMTAGIGGLVVARQRLTQTSADTWLVAIAATIVVTMILYVPRNLPSVGLYYYGRYLVPEILPLAALLATAGVHAVHRRLAKWPRSRRDGATAAWVAGLFFGTAGVLVTDPVTRLREFSGAEKLLESLAERLPPGAVVIAGGEGWHHGHTFNQVGGALALRHDVTVLPYRTREAAYASLHELLVARPHATGEPAPPVFVLLNEAAQPLHRDDGIIIAAIDDRLPAPFVATRIDLLELFVHRLTPERDAIPTRVTRDALRMGLFRIEVDDARADAIETWRISAHRRKPRAHGQRKLAVRGGRPRKGHACLDLDKPLRIKVPRRGTAGKGAVSVVLVATPGTAPINERWTIEIDGVPQSATPTGDPIRARDTLGPFVVAKRPRSIVIRGSPDGIAEAPCQLGGLAEVRILPADAPALDRVAPDVHVFVPPHDLGRPFAPARWVSGRALSRYRAGIVPPPAIHALSMVLPAGGRLVFAPELVPGGKAPHELVVTLTQSHVPQGARLLVRADDEVIAEIEPPRDRGRAWQSPAVAFTAPRRTATIALELLADDPSAVVHVRDVALFARP